ncbi:MAG: acylneuraminate cytidylyltransferase family protein [Nitrospirae bacterium]|nr:MAG: acylneuraminate cytidylyltransferase family protein [Nitrospirota bacterium]
MNASAGMLAVIPARGGSKGLPGKNIRPFAGLPLIAHSVLLAKACPEIARAIISTDAEEIAAVAQRHGGEVPFLRPAELARDDTPLWDVIRHALATVESREGLRYDYLVLLDPTTPCRLPEQIAEAYRRLEANPSADGIVGVSKPDFNPVWHSVVEREGWMTDLIPNGGNYARRQDAPTVCRINGTLYIWRAEFVRRSEAGWRNHGRHLMYEVADFAAISIDTLEEFERAELFVTSGRFPLPWLGNLHPGSCVH